MYATREELNAYIVGGVTSLGFEDDDKTINPILTQASRDVDQRVGFGWSMESNGFRFGDLGQNPKQLSAAQLVALRRATCAQAEYRMVKGEEFFRHGQHKSTSGPDFSTQGKLPRFGPKASEELAASGLRRAVGGPLVR